MRDRMGDSARQPKPVTIRLALLSDIPAIETLIGESARALSAGYYSPFQIENALKHVFGVDSQLILDGTFFVAEVEGQIVGCGGWSRGKTLFGGDQTKSDEPEPLLDPKTDSARVRAFFVDPRWSRRGIGTELLRNCEGAARAAGFKKVELVATLPGQPLYSARGYRTIEPFEIEMVGGLQLPAFRMGKNLDYRRGLM
jgi:GNAT superfamily N-acetyltransferase